MLKCKASINIIQVKCENKNTFTFVDVNTEEIKKDIQTLTSKKASKYSDISTKIIKKTQAFFWISYVLL